MNYIRLGIGLALVCQTVVYARPISVTEVNSFRNSAGLPSLQLSEPLIQAAESHANYLARYVPIDRYISVSAHKQKPHLVDFTGSLAADRAMYFGYPHSQVLENISLGNHSVNDSVGDLMSAIYHRFSFLDFDVDEIGAAVSNQRYVYNLGKRALSQICQRQPEASVTQQYVDCLGKSILQSSFDRLCANLPKEAVFTAPFPARCENGELINAKYMQEICKSPPSDAILTGSGAYIDACGDGTKISARWFGRACASERKDILFQYSGNVYQICSPKVDVYAEWYQNHCANLTPEGENADSGRYYDICANGYKIKSEYYQFQQSQRLGDLPEIVIWPPNGAVDIKPVFYDEDPHPTPDLSMTGYPISIQFNPQKIESVRISNFTLEKSSAADPDWRPVSGFRLIDDKSDVNRQFTSHQFAWFPLKRLEWGAHYRYRIDVIADGIHKQYSAKFQVASFDVPLYDVSDEIGQITATERQFIMYRAPTEGDAFPFRDINLSYKSRIIVRANVIDSNTVEFKIDGEGCAPLFIHTRQDERIRVDRCSHADRQSLF